MSSISHPSGNASSSPAVPDEVARALGELMHRNSLRWKSLIVLEGVGFAIAAGLGYLWVVFLLDNVLHLPVLGRGVASLGLIVVLVLLARTLIRRWRHLSFTDDEVALAIERRMPGGVQNQLINALQIARDSRSTPTEFNRAVVEGNWRRLQELHLQHARAMRPAFLRISLGGLMIVLGVGFWIFQPERFANAAARILLPFASVDPLYRTRLQITPGDMEAAGDATITILILGERPTELTILEQTEGARRSHKIPVPPVTKGSGEATAGDVVQYTFRGLERSMQYAVRGGDYTTPYYRIEVPTATNVSLVRAVYDYPEYTGLDDKTQEIGAGDLEALLGTRARLTFFLDQPCEEAALLLLRPQAIAGEGAEERHALKLEQPTEASGELEFRDVNGYQIETRRNGRTTRSIAYGVRVLDDQPPKLDLVGLEQQTEITIEATLPLKITANDDFGLEEVGLFVRRIVDTTSAANPASATNPAATDADATAPPADKPATEKPPAEKPPVAKETVIPWTAVEVWPGQKKQEMLRQFELSLLALGAVEGEKLEVALQGRDTDPLKAGEWTAGTSYPLFVGGEGAALQFRYEQILKTEAEIKAVLGSVRDLMGQADDWIKKFEPDSGVNWSDPQSLVALETAVKAQGVAQEKIRKQASHAAREMISQAGNLRLSLGMLADTEMIRAIRILESVPVRDELQGKRAALADARLTEERTINSLQEIQEQYVKFRQDWELSHMIPFVRMLTDREAALRDGSQRNVELPQDKLAEVRKTSGHRRQVKVLELTVLSAVAFNGLADRVAENSPLLEEAFANAATQLEATPLKQSLQKGAEAAQEGRWKDAALQQSVAADALEEIYTQLRKAQLEAAQKALAALQERAQSDLDAQQELENLKAGSGEDLIDMPGKLSLEEIIHMREQEKKKNENNPDAKPFVENYLFPDSAKSMLQRPDTGMRQEFENLSLAKTPGKTPSFPKQSDREGNRVKPHIQEKFDDLVGELLEEADEMQEKYETYNLNAAFNINEKGDVGKQGGDLNSTAASAATGNQKPPTTNVGGASRSGRRGARSFGTVVGDEAINRRGRDKVQEGQERAPDQAGLIKETDSDDPQKDTSTGIGGKRVDSEETKFSVADAGKWTDDMADRMQKPQKKNSIVERQGDRIDPKVAELLYDMTSEQEQVIERVKTIRKELKNLYLPTEHLDELIAELQSNLDSMKERPSGEVFRQQQRALDRLRSTLKVLHQAHTGFEPSVPREQTVQGRVLDEPARATVPGYEEAVKRYYEKLTER